MSDNVKLIVTLSKGQYESLKNIQCGSIGSRMIVNAVMNGIPLEESRPKGEWKRKVHYLDIFWECSNCGHNSNYYSPLYNFCPDCGADMRGE